ncbi:hypothetical protein BGW80DRAFT_1560383 [Lactifluus volemus]|nr:hypothetical protein BGW80DRAFT_1560383 [Lactifluus volemus]
MHDDTVVIRFSSGPFRPRGYTQFVRSLTTMTAAGIISLLNDFRISKSEPPLGFLNPLLYSSASEGINAITSGSNPGCGTQGFSAVAGCQWDLVTGLGTPDFLKLKDILSRLRYGW